MAAADLEELGRLLAAGDEQGALDRLQAGLGWPAGKALDPAELPRWVAGIAELARRRGGAALAERAEDVVRNPDNTRKLYDLGYSLIDADAPALAAGVLWRCLALAGDGEQVVSELVSALETALAHPDAFAILDERPALRAQSFLCRYLHAFNAAMAGRLDVARREVPRLAPDTERAQAMAASLAAMIERADRIAGASPLDSRDLRGWHYVLTGTLLVHQSPYGFHEPMRGRYAWLTDALPRVATGLDRLAALIRALALPCVYAPPGRDHEILARAAAARLGLPFAPWPAVGVPAPGLVVLYDLADLSAEDVQRLIPRRPAQIVFAHASPWTQDGPIAPDVTTLLYQTLVPPWGESLAVDPETREVRRRGADARPAEVIAAELAASPGLDDAELAADEPARWSALVAHAWPPPSSGRRARSWAGGPVPSSRFA